MSSSLDFAEFVLEQLHGVGVLRLKKMFGEYFIYVNERPMVLICDNTAYIKPHQALENLLQNNDKQPPYQGAKPWYVLDIEDTEVLHQAVRIRLPFTPIPAKKSRQSKNQK